MPNLGTLTTDHGPVRLRFAGADDATQICRLIRALARYERLAHESDPDPHALSEHLKGDGKPGLEAILAINEEDRVVGFALFFSNYSTFLTQWGLYLEDLFVEPDYRGAGIGFALLRTVAELAAERGCGRLDWAVLAWNAPAIDFYRQLGAEMKGDWRIMRLEGKALDNLTTSGSPHQTPA